MILCKMKHSQYAEPVFCIQLFCKPYSAGRFEDKSAWSARIDNLRSEWFKWQEVRMEGTKLCALGALLFKSAEEDTDSLAEY